MVRGGRPSSAQRTRGAPGTAPAARLTDGTAAGAHECESIINPSDVSLIRVKYRHKASNTQDELVQDMERKAKSPGPDPSKRNTRHVRDNPTRRHKTTA